jgi:hypothetical protein
MPLWNKRSRGDDLEREERVNTSEAENGATGEQSKVTPINPPVEYRGSIAEEGFTPLLATGIVNPFGPTLTVLAVEGDTPSRRERPVLRLVFNPFLQNFEQVGVARQGDTRSLESQLPPFFPLYAEESCPTLLMHSPVLGHEQAVTVFADLLATVRDGESVLRGVRRHPGDPMNRVQEQMDELTAALEASLSVHETDRKLTDTEARELAMNLLNPDNQFAETKAFLYAWKGSIEFQGNGAMAANAFSFDNFAPWFASVATSCRLLGFGD